MTATTPSIDPNAMPDRPTLASFFVRILTNHYAAHGRPAEQLFAGCRLDPATLDDPEQRFPLHDFLRLCEFAANELHDPCLGLGLGTRMNPDYLGPYGFALMSSNTPREMMVQAERYSVLAIGGGSHVFEERDGECIRCWRHGEAEATPGWRIMDELGLVPLLATGGSGAL